MNDRRCPTEIELFRFVDADLSPEQLEQLEKHLRSCSGCAKQVAALRALVADVAAPLDAAPIDVAEHVSGVMARLDEPASPRRRPHVAWWAGLLTTAAAMTLFVVLRSEDPDLAQGQFAARGERSEASLSRDVGVQLYAHDRERALPLGTGHRLRADAALTAGLRNLGREPAYLLLFAIDARGAVHWIAPEFSTPDTDPEAVSITPSSSERLLPTAAVFDDLATGPLEVVAVVARRPLRVSDIESLSPDVLREQALKGRFPRTDVQRFSLEVTP